MVMARLGKHLIMGSIADLINEAFRAVAYGRTGLIDKEEALDRLWELLVNIDYEIKRRYQSIEILEN
ncbi:hypothetical protein [Vulcanisaeta souniana]|nr:hypothetical protein [Vulcanisaeta souniana]